MHNESDTARWKEEVDRLTEVDPQLDNIMKGPSEKLVRAILDTLTEYQRRAVNILDDHLCDSLVGRDPEQLLLLVIGEAGTGKSKVIEAMTSSVKYSPKGHRRAAARRNACHADIINEARARLRHGEDADVIALDRSIGTLRDRTPQWLIKAFQAINKKELILKSWELSCTSRFNLSYSSLTSREALQAVLDLRKQDPEFYRAITSGQPDNHNFGTGAPEPDEADQDLTDEEDVTVGTPYDDMSSSSSMEPESEDEIFAKCPAADPQAAPGLEDAPSPISMQDQSLKNIATRPVRSRRVPTRFIGGQWWDTEEELDGELA
ncbi:hypothetical protein FRC01_004623 [Tulasnella sp. 417]|nr:hypothetical protein FRC01_004623 [Tulasnella sp. 417]